MKKLLILCVLIIFALPTLALADGRSDYRAKCAGCHGAYPNSPPDWEKAKLLKADIKKLVLSGSAMNEAEMIAVIEKGKGTMPSYENDLKKDQMTAIVDYIKSFNKK
jgi:mono/diheme cytochrome c family protein